MSTFKRSERLILNKQELMDLLVKFSECYLPEEEAGKISIAQCQDFLDEWIETNTSYYNG